MDDQVQQFIDKAAANTSTIATSVGDIMREVDLYDSITPESKEKIRSRLEDILRAAV